MAFIKALALGAFLTWLVSLFVGSTGSTGGQLYIQHFRLGGGYTLLWSWPLFVSSTGLSWGILWMMR